MALRKTINRLALLTALAVGMAQPAWSEELGEVDLYDPGVHEFSPELEDAYEELGEFSLEGEPEPAEPLVVTPKQMLVNLRASKCLGTKRDVVLGVMKALMKAGFEPTFAAGVGANVLAEGSYGMFERSDYDENPEARPRYFCYLDGGACYTRQGGAYVLSAEYLSREALDAYEGEAEPLLRFGEENFYRDNYSGRYVQRVSLSALEALLDALEADGWQGVFGLGIAQWTGVHTRQLVQLYRERAGDSDTITTTQVVAAENEMIVRDFKGGYWELYAAWRALNDGKLDTEEAARSAAKMVCTGYEKPVGMHAKARKRGAKAAEIYRIMAGESL